MQRNRRRRKDGIARLRCRLPRQRAVTFAVSGGGPIGTKITPRRRPDRTFPEELMAVSVVVVPTIDARLSSAGQTAMMC